ncbi:uncharacterized protein BO80DRAFT_465098 [Aspergillus ibericus CBS 121593]|uniref:Non-homologous end-joining factor 1 n=1 Tax=Aspergillus ibericus CBS 121593 TaxID=1448316 RepID=A0A395H000_9EURO|nr:XLF-domain-containing protein [Aspergillus ibericus CBS 121593]RAL00615.1 XLF-domain-containing protein [Aspergillus ibericus CBS 121593]
MSSKWQRLHLSNDRLAPPLLFHYSVSENGYQLYITDLTHIWSENLNRRHILRRAADDDATIDPSEDTEQFSVLLQKIGDGLRNEPGSSTALSHGPESDSLQLITSTKLPAPLQPLKWIIYLFKEPQSSLTAQLLLPLIKAETGWEARQRGLIELLNTKDWVLVKLFDKLEAMGVDISTVFPGITGFRTSHKGSMLTQAAKYIKGVAPFDEQAWLDEANVSSLGLGLASAIMTKAAGSSTDDMAQQLESLCPASDGWWKTLTPSNIPATNKPPEQRENSKGVDSKPPQSSEEPERTDGGTETEDDEFERQETPPRLKRPPASKVKSPSPRLEEETESDDEDEDVQRKQGRVKPPAPREKPLVKPSKGLGVIGGKKQQPPKQYSPQPSSPLSPDIDTPALAPKSSPPQPNNDETESEPDEDDQPFPSSPPPSKPQSSTIPPTKPRVLGVIGGRNKEKEASSPPPSLQPEPSSKPQTRPRGLGVIGGKKKDRQASPLPSRQSPEPQNTISKSHSPAPEQQPKAPPPPPIEQEKEETEQEKADRKRDELKRQLDAKSKAPAKKKRKF